MRAIRDDGNRRAGRATFYPRDISGCVLWVRADLGVSVDVSNNVTGVVDYSGRGATVAQGTAARQPLLVASGINGRPSIRGNADQHRGLAVSGVTIAGAMTLVVVLTKSSKIFSYHWRGADDAASCIIGNFSGSLIEWYSGNNTDRQTFVTTPTAGPHLLVVTQTDGASLVGRYDRSQVFSVVPTAAITAPSVLGSDGVYGNASDGDIGEAAVWNRVLTSSEIARVEYDFRARWATP